MNNWMKEHRILFACAAVFAGLQCMLYFLVLAPRRERTLDLESSVQSMQERMRGGTLPADAAKLEKFLDELKKELDNKPGKNSSALRLRSEKALAKAGETFSSRIKSEYGTVSEFMTGVPRLDYQSEYNRVVTVLGGKGIFLSPEVLKLTEDAPSPYTYQLMMQIWTVEKLAELAMAADVRITAKKQIRRPGGKNVKAAEITVGQMKAYVQNEDDNNPYLLEFPVSVSIEGSLTSCMNFINSLTADGVFIPPVSFEIFALPPADFKGGENGLLPPGNTAMNLVCSSFLVIPPKK